MFVERPGPLNQSGKKGIEASGPSAEGQPA